MSWSRPSTAASNRIEKKHRVAVLRAADKVAKRMHWEKWQCQRFGQGGWWAASPSLEGRGAIYVNLLDPRSYGLGMVREDPSGAGKSMAELEAELDDEDLAPGGAWWLAVERAKAKFGIAVDPETQSMIDARAAETKQTRDEMVAAFGVPPAERERRARRGEANAHGRICGKCGKAIEPNAPLVRKSVVTRGWMGTGMTIEVQCLGCAPASSLDGMYSTKCKTCGREVYQRYRRNRRRTFCCDDCRLRPSKRRADREAEPTIDLRRHSID
jgi:hypothetical protein